MLHLDYLITGAWLGGHHSLSQLEKLQLKSDMDGILIIKILFGYSRFHPCTCWRLLFIKFAVGTSKHCLRYDSENNDSIRLYSQSNG